MKGINVACLVGLCLAITNACSNDDPVPGGTGGASDAGQAGDDAGGATASGGTTVRGGATAKGGTNGPGAGGLIGNGGKTNGGSGGSTVVSGGSSGDGAGGVLVGGGSTAGGPPQMSGGQGSAGDAQVGAAGGTVPDASGGQGSGGETQQGTAGASAGAGGDGGAVNPYARLICPSRLGDVRQFDADGWQEVPLDGWDPEYLPLESDIAAAFGCVDDAVSDMKNLYVWRFQVDAGTAALLWINHILDIPGGFAILPDCQLNGVQHPTYTNYPKILAQSEPGIYTAVGCSQRMPLLRQYAVPVSTNLDCARAAPLPARDIILDDQHRFYAFNVESDTDLLEVELSTDQTSAAGSVTVRGVDNGYMRTDSLEYLLDRTGFSFQFESVPAGNYCIEVSTSVGVEYRVSAAARN